MSKKQKRLLFRIILSSLLFALALVLPYVLNLFYVYGIPEIVFYVFPYLVIGYPVLKKAAVNIINGQIFGENFLMTLATIGAFIIGEYPEAVFVMLFYQVGELFESIAVGKSRKSISSLMDLRPDTATVLRDGVEITVSPEDVSVGELLVIRPGERIPLDGTVINGTSSLNTVQLTGESKPLDVVEGSSILSGCINISGKLEMSADKPYCESAASRILKLVEESSKWKAKSEAFISKFARYYTPIVVISALLLAFIPPIFNGDLSSSVYKALNLLVISCPCALVISVPLTFFAGIGSASKNGILVKGSQYLERLAKADTFVFDKTGTLTEGVFEIDKIYPEGITEDELLTYAEAAERFSNHPIALSVRNAFGNRTPLIIDGAEELAGRGVCVGVSGKKLYAGNLRLMKDIGVITPGTAYIGTVLYIALDGKYMGRIVISDRVKKESSDALKLLKKRGAKKLVMLTGDNESVAESVARKLPLDCYYSSLLPDGKVEIVRGLLQNKKEGSFLVFVGDGINDAPVLGYADVGVAMGGVGSDAAIEASDIVIIDDDLDRLPRAVLIARKTLSIVNQNISFSIFIKVSMMILSIFGLCPMWAAVFADVGVMALAVLNSLRAMKI